MFGSLRYVFRKLFKQLILDSAEEGARDAARDIAQRYGIEIPPEVLAQGATVLVVQTPAPGQIPQGQHPAQRPLKPAPAVTDPSHPQAPPAPAPVPPHGPGLTPSDNGPPLPPRRPRGRPRKTQEGQP